MSETTTYREALRQAHRIALANDERVVLMGEDVGAYGGAYAASKGLLEEFGAKRVRDTPLSESGFVGAGIGAAIGGMRPIVELMTVNFSLLCFDQIVNVAATMRHMSGGQISVPIVIRMATGAGRQLAAQHSHSLDGWFAHVPGLRVVAPATITDANGMLPAALADPDPVIILEHSALYSMEGKLDHNHPVSLEGAAIRRPGTQVTIIGYGGNVAKAMQAATALDKDGIDAEVIDLRSLRPLDTPTLIESVSRTRRAVVIDEMWKSGSFAAEIVAQLAEEAFYELEAPLARVCTEEVPIPYAKHLEAAALPNAEKIALAVRDLFGNG